jgi:hypothetical protein
MAQGISARWKEGCSTTPLCLRAAAIQVPPLLVRMMGLTVTEMAPSGPSKFHWSALDSRR